MEDESKTIVVDRIDFRMDIWSKNSIIKTVTSNKKILQKKPPWGTLNYEKYAKFSRKATRFDEKYLQLGEILTLYVKKSISIIYCAMFSSWNFSYPDEKFDVPKKIFPQ